MAKNYQGFDAKVEIVNIVNHIKKYFTENGGLHSEDNVWSF